MEKYINIWRGESAPKDRDALWVHHLERNNSQSPIIISIYKQGKWVDFLADYMSSKTPELPDNPGLIPENPAI